MAPLPTDEFDVGTLLAAFARTVAARGAEPALRCGDATLTWAEYAHHAGAVAAALAERGVGTGDHVVLLMRNRPEFHLVDTACMMLGAVTVSVYLSPSVDALAQAIAACGAVAVIAENASFLHRARAALGAARPLLVGVDPDTAAPDVVPFDEMRDHPDRAEPVAAEPGDVVTMLFTSGTTGPPKGVPLTHANLLFTARTLGRRMGVSLTGKRQLSYLPMAHIGERNATHYVHLVQGSVVTCCPDLTQLPGVLRATSPHMFFGAPRIWERLHDQIVARGGDPLVAATELGLGDVEVAIVGSAPLPRHVHEFWLGLGVPLADCYGQTESCGMGAWDPHDLVLGTCGKPFDGMELRIAADGEILVRGPAVFSGYFRNPEATATALDADGWYHSGDLGRLDTGGNLVLGGRRNDVLVPTSGHNVNPESLEEELCRIPGVAHAMVVGHGRPHLAAVVELLPDADPTALDPGIAAINERRPGAERIRSHLVVDESWELASDVLTATGKMRRTGIATRYATAIEELYDLAGR